MTRFFFFLLLNTSLSSVVQASSLSAVDYESFLGTHDMLWDRLPNRWEVAPYTGNGNVGFLFYQAKDEAKNVISIYAGRHDYYDHRLPVDGKEMLWIYRSRLPLGHFNLESKGKITGVDLRSIKPIAVSDADRNLFGLSEKTKRLPGHQYYFAK